MLSFQKEIKEVVDNILRYVEISQDFSPGEYYGSFWSEKAFHGPLLDYHAGGSHHHRGAGSAALLMWLSALDGNHTARYNSELAFDWLAARQHPRGGWFEIQNNEKTSDWENTGLEELSAIPSAFALHGLGNALLNGLPPKKSYMDCLQKAGYWFLELEWPSGSGVFPHHERSPYDTLNADAHAVESLALIFKCLDEIYNLRVNIFLQGAIRGFNHTLPLQWENGCYPYRFDDGITINYTSLVLWCFLNALEVAPEIEEFAPFGKQVIKSSFDKAASFLRSCVKEDGSLEWDKNETSTAKHNVWTYAITANVLVRIGGVENIDKAESLITRLVSLKTDSGLLPMRDTGEQITECLFMQADMALFLKGVIGRSFVE